MMGVLIGIKTKKNDWVHILLIKLKHFKV
jgi:hypothetical protein